MGLLSAQDKKRVTLDKINKYLRNEVKNTEYSLKIIQTHNEAKYVTLLQRNRNKVAGLILNLGPFHLESHLIQNTLSLIKLPYFIVEDKNQLKNYIKETLFNNKYIIQNSDINQAYLEGMERLLNL